MPTFNASQLLQDYGDEGLVHDLAQLLVDTTPAQMDAVRTAVDTQDGAALRAAAHKLRGSIVTFGVPAAVEAARRLETMGASGDFNGADELTRQLVADVQLLRESARAWLETGAASP